MKTTIITGTILLGSLFLNDLKAQDLPKPSSSAEIKQRIGLTDVTIAYSRPNVNDREIFGGLVPYNEIWRTGANMNTLITFTDDVKVEGKEVKAGTYSIFTFPGEKEWKIVFNSETKSWGTGGYDETNNVFEATVPTKTTNHHESMEFSFENIQIENGFMQLAWNTTLIELKIEVNVKEKAWKNIETAIAEVTDKNKASVYRNCAKYCADNNMELDKALAWIEESIKAQEYWFSYWVKADVLHAKGDNKGAVASAKKAIELGEAGAKESGKPFTYKSRLEEAIKNYQ